MLQVIRAIMKDPHDPTVCHLLFANQVSGCPETRKLGSCREGAQGLRGTAQGVCAAPWLKREGAPSVPCTGSFPVASGGQVFQPRV